MVKPGREECLCLDTGILSKMWLQTGCTFPLPWVNRFPFLLRFSSPPMSFLVETVLCHGQVYHSDSGLFLDGAASLSPAGVWLCVTALLQSGELSGPALLLVHLATPFEMQGLIL